MKRILILLAVVMLINSCTKDTKEEEDLGPSSYSVKAVFKGPSYMYKYKRTNGVTLPAFKAHNSQGNDTIVEINFGQVKRGDAVTLQIAHCTSNNSSFTVYVDEDIINFPTVSDTTLFSGITECQSSGKTGLKAECVLNKENVEAYGTP